MEKIKYYDELLEYSTHLFNRNLKVFSQNLYNPIDFVHEAFLIGYDDIDKAKKIIVDRILKEKRRLIAAIQQSENRSQFDVRDKKCCKCKLQKPIDEFKPRVEKSTGYCYYNSYCDTCQHEIYTSPETRKKNREFYARDSSQREKSRIRQERWRNKHRAGENAHSTPPQIVNKIFGQWNYGRTKFEREPSYFGTYRTKHGTRDIICTST